MRIAFVALTLAVVIVTCGAYGQVSSVGAAESFRFKTFTVPGADETVALGINNFGEIVGSYIIGFATRAYLRHSDGTIIGLSGPIDTDTVSASGISGSGEIVGFYGDHSDNSRHGFLLNRGTYTSFDAPGGAGQTSAYGVNSSGQIVGLYSDKVKTHAFIRDADGSFVSFDYPGALFTSAFGIDDQGRTSGTFSLDSMKTSGFVREPDGTFTVFDAPGTVGATYPFGMNNSGQVVGSLRQVNGFLRASDGAFIGIDIPAAFDTLAYGINDLGYVVGEWGDGTGRGYAFIARPGRRSRYRLFDSPER